MRQYRDKVLAALQKHHHGTFRALLAVFASASLAAWTGQGTHPTAVHKGPGAKGAIVSAAHGKCLSYYPTYTGTARSAHIDECDGGSAEVWTVPADNTVRTQGKCLTVEKEANGTGLVLAECDGSPMQFWEVDGIVRVPGTELLNPWSGKCLTDPNGSTLDDTQVQISTCTRSAAQTWYVPPSKP